MRPLICVALLLCALAASSSASAVTLVNPDGSVAQPYQSWAESSHVPVVDGRLGFTASDVNCGPRPIGGCASRAGWIAVVPRPDADETRHVMFHELGHEFDFAMPDWKRQVFRRILRLPSTPWWTDHPHIEFSLSEEFADFYADCAVADHAEVAFITPTPDDLQEVPARHVRRICRLMRQ